PATGNVGIGTLNPVTPLTIYNAAGMGHLTIQSNDNPTISSRADIDFHVVTTGHMMSRISGYYENSVGGGFGGLFLSTNYNGTISERMRILSNGNVGIGTTTPQSKLEVAGSLYSYACGYGMEDVSTSTKNYANYSSDNNGSVVISTNLFTSGDNLKIAKTHTTMSGSAILIPGNYQPHQNGIVFYTTPPASVTTGDNYKGNISMLITAEGNVGIGTTSPTEKFAVNGNIRSRKLIVTQQGWPDYVFDSTYTLTPLAQVEQFIKDNKHLPDVPSAKEVTDKGLDVGDNQAMLLKKIEELTLYMIEQNKKMDEMKKENNRTKNEMTKKIEAQQKEIELLKSEK
ncbi:hypothetical protein ACI6Q2_23350, partial [Chitinophagaceae bacterium LWZ2-11]